MLTQCKDCNQLTKVTIIRVLQCYYCVRLVVSCYHLITDTMVMIVVIFGYKGCIAVVNTL